MTGRDYDDPDDLPGLADVDPPPLTMPAVDRWLGDQLARIPPPPMGPPRRDRWNLPTPDVVGRHITERVLLTGENAIRRILAGESIVLGPGATPADLLAGHLVEIPFPFQPKEPTMPDQPTTDRPTAGEAHAAAIDEVRRYRTELADAQPAEDMRRRRAHVADGLNTLGVELDDLERLVNVLEERIAPILGPSEPMPGGPEAVHDSPAGMPGGPSELAELIFARNRHAGAIAARLARVIDRIDV